MQVFPAAMRILFFCNRNKELFCILLITFDQSLSVVVLVT